MVRVFECGWTSLFLSMSSPEVAPVEVSEPTRNAFAKVVLVE
jgi:hypothetical protein